MQIQNDSFTMIRNQQILKKTMYQFTNAIHNLIQDFLPNGIVATSIVVCSIFFASYQLFRMEELSISPCANLIWNQRGEGRRKKKRSW